jgi:hypothetical protein
MKRSTKHLLIGGAVVAGLVGGVVWYKKAYAAPAVPTSLPPGSITPVATFASGQKYTFVAQTPTGISDTTALTAALANVGWSNVNVVYFAGSGNIPTGFPTVASNGYIATGTWNGASNAPVPAGVVAAATP